MTVQEPRAATVPEVDALVQVSFTVMDVLTKTSAEFDLSVTQLRLLGILRDRTPSMAAIAGHLKLDRSSVSGLIDRAERRGLVARRTSTEDARVTIIDITPAGIELGQQLAASVNSRIEQLLDAAPTSARKVVLALAESLARPVPTDDQALAMTSSTSAPELTTVAPTDSRRSSGSV